MLLDPWKAMRSKKLMLKIKTQDKINWLQHLWNLFHVWRRSFLFNIYGFLFGCLGNWPLYLPGCFLVFAFLLYVVNFGWLASSGCCSTGFGGSCLLLGSLAAALFNLFLFWGLIRFLSSLATNFGSLVFSGWWGAPSWLFILSDVLVVFQKLSVYMDRS